MGGALNQKSFLAARPLGDFDETLGVGTFWAADNQQAIDAVSYGLDGVLAVGGGVADVLFDRTGNLRKAVFQNLDDLGRVVDRKRGLGGVGEFLRIAGLDSPGVGRRFNQRDSAVGQLPHSADDLRVAAMADQHDFPALLVVARCFHVYFGNQRAGCIENEHIAGIGGGWHGLSHAVC